MPTLVSVSQLLGKRAYSEQVEPSAILQNEVTFSPFAPLKSNFKDAAAFNPETNLIEILKTPQQHSETETVTEDC